MITVSTGSIAADRLVLNQRAKVLLLDRSRRLETRRKPSVEHDLGWIQYYIQARINLRENKAAISVAESIRTKKHESKVTGIVWCDLTFVYLKKKNPKLRYQVQKGV